MGLKLKYKALSDVGKVRKANEDCFGELISKESNGNGNLFIVCDGMGGHVGGAVASQTAVNSIKDFFRSEYYPDPLKAIEKSILFANQKVYQLSQERSDLRGMGTTCVVLLQRDNDIYIAHVGDSRIYLQSNKQIYRLTKDHSYVQSLVDMGEIVEMDGMSIDEQMENHPRSNELSRAIGIRKDVSVEVCPTPIFAKSGDTFLLCTDGLTGLVNDPTISNTLNNSIDNNKIAKELISMANNAGGKDNITVSLISITESPHRNSQFIDKSNQSNLISGTQEHYVESNSSSISNFFNKLSYYFNKKKKIFLVLFFVVFCAFASIIIIKKQKQIVKEIPEKSILEEQKEEGKEEELDNNNGPVTTITDDDRDKVEKREAKEADEKKKQKAVNDQLAVIERYEKKNPNWKTNYQKIQKKLDPKEYNKYYNKFIDECKKCKNCTDDKKKKNCKKFKDGDELLVFTKAGVLFFRRSLRNDIEKVSTKSLGVEQESLKNQQEIKDREEMDTYIKKFEDEGYTSCLFSKNKKLFNALKKWDAADYDFILKINKDRSKPAYGENFRVIMYKCVSPEPKKKRSCLNWIKTQK